MAMLRKCDDAGGQAGVVNTILKSDLVGNCTADLFFVPPGNIRYAAIPVQASDYDYVDAFATIRVPIRVRPCTCYSVAAPCVVCRSYDRATREREARMAQGTRNG